MTLRILVFGGSGQVGSALSSLGCQGLQVFPVLRSDANLMDPATCTAIIEETSAHVVINAAAFTDVDLAELTPEIAIQVNAVAPGLLAEAAKAKGMPFLHISTNFVFDGSGSTPWVEKDVANPLTAYGQSKHQGELAVLQVGGRAAVLRASWIYDTDGVNFYTAMQKAASGCQPVPIANDQWGGPTSAKSVANALVLMARAFVADRAPTGIYHFQGTPFVTWFGFAKAIFARSGLQKLPPLIPVASSDKSDLAVRPKNGRLDCSHIARKFGIRQPNWRDELTKMLLSAKEIVT